jgi:nickel/cobalt exporter
MIEPVLLSTIAVAFFHSLAPDHWMPLAALAKSQKWSMLRLIGITILTGLGHVGSSIILGACGIILGITVTNLTDIESSRGAVSGLLLIGFGIAYGIWGLKQIRHSHKKITAHKAFTVWALVLIFVLGPCETLIPIMFLGIQYGWKEVWLLSILFSIITISMMLIQTIVVYKGLQFLLTEKLERWAHATCGFVIAFTGVLVMVLGI